MSSVGREVVTETTTSNLGGTRTAGVGSGAPSKAARSPVLRNMPGENGVSPEAICFFVVGGEATVGAANSAGKQGVFNPSCRHLMDGHAVVASLLGVLVLITCVETTAGVIAISVS